MRSRRLFTLLEILVSIALLMMASGVVGWRMYGAIKKKRFHAEIEGLRSRFMVCHKLAMAMQADWRGKLQKEGDEWLFTVECEEGTNRFSPLRLRINLLWNGKPQKEIDFDFFATGKVSPLGTLLLSQNDEREEWKMDQLFQREEGKKQGPAHPSKK